MKRKVPAYWWMRGWVALNAWAFPALAWAVPTLGQIGQYQQNTAQGLSAGAYYFFLFLGLVFTGMGLIAAYAAHKRHESMTLGIVMAIVGVLLLSLPTIIMSGSSTIFQGTNESQLNQLGVGG